MTSKTSPTKSPTSNDLTKTKGKAKPSKKTAKTEKPIENNGLPEKHAGGRPSKYRPEYPAMLMEYFNIEAGEQETAENSKGQVCYIYKPAKLPTLAGFACQIDVCRDTLHEWSNTHKEFSDALKRAKEHQERILVENGLLGGYDRTFAIFTAKNLIDWRDKQEQTTTHEIGDTLKEFLGQLSGKTVGPPSER